MTEYILKSVGRGGDHDRENKGKTTEGDSGVFKKQWIENFKNRKIFESNIIPEWIITTCDPNGGGSSSDTSFISCYYHEGKMIICGKKIHIISFIKIFNDFK